MPSTFITKPGFKSPRWQQAFPDAQILTAETSESNGLIWVLIGVNSWQKQISDFTRQGNPVIAMTLDPSAEQLREALSAGAKGYIEAMASSAILQQAGQTVTNGAMWLPAPLVAGLVAIVSRALEKQQTERPDLSMLTEREREVTMEVIKGALNKQVADKLNITERTVKAHLASVFAKLGVRDRMQLMLKVRGKS